MTVAQLLQHTGVARTCEKRNVLKSISKVAVMILFFIVRREQMLFCSQAHFACLLQRGSGWRLRMLRGIVLLLLVSSTYAAVGDIYRLALNDDTNLYVFVVVVMAATTTFRLQ